MHGGLGGDFHDKRSAYGGVVKTMADAGLPLTGIMQPQCRLVAWWLLYTRAGLSMPGFTGIFRTGIDAYVPVLTDELSVRCDTQCENRVANGAFTTRNRHAAMDQPDVQWDDVNCTAKYAWIIDEAKELVHHLHL